jgi:hypothetical protein
MNVRVKVKRSLASNLLPLSSQLFCSLGGSCLCCLFLSAVSYGIDWEDPLLTVLTGRTYRDP